MIRKELPESRGRLPLRCELLGILGNTLVSEHYRSRQLEATSRRLAEAAEATDRFLAVFSTSSGRRSPPSWDTPCSSAVGSWGRRQPRTRSR